MCYRCPINKLYYYNDATYGKLYKVSCSDLFVDENTIICYDECPEITLYSLSVTPAKGKYFFFSK